MACFTLTMSLTESFGNADHQIEAGFDALEDCAGKGEQKSPQPRARLLHGLIDGIANSLQSGRAVRLAGVTPATMFVPIKAELRVAHQTAGNTLTTILVWVTRSHSQGDNLRRWIGIEAVGTSRRHRRAGQQTRLLDHLRRSLTAATTFWAAS
jgi:hypothetical protein